jgi:hypothetical protein
MSGQSAANALMVIVLSVAWAGCVANVDPEDDHSPTVMRILDGLDESSGRILPIAYRAIARTAEGSQSQRVVANVSLTNRGSTPVSFSASCMGTFQEAARSADTEYQIRSPNHLGCADIAMTVEPGATWSAETNWNGTYAHNPQDDHSTWAGPWKPVPAGTYDWTIAQRVTAKNGTSETVRVSLRIAIG